MEDDISEEARVVVSSSSPSPKKTTSLKVKSVVYRLYSTDSDGSLSTLFLDPNGNRKGSSEATQPRLLLSSHGTHEKLVQKMVGGELGGLWVIALGRKDGTIEVVLPLPQPNQESDYDNDKEVAKLLYTIREPRMKPGIQRWVGLAVEKKGIFSCTSNGDFRFTPLSFSSTTTTTTTTTSSSSSSSSPDSPLPASFSSTPPILEQTGESSLFEFPNPLQHLVFYPSSNPKYFCFGGEEIPPSLWSVAQLLDSDDGENDTVEEGANGTSARLQKETVKKDGQNDVDEERDQEEGNAKMRKRKRRAESRAKNKELLSGEVWRAKNLPNDTLSLPQRANVVQIAFLSLKESEQSKQGVPEQIHLAVGTRNGLVRLFEPSNGSRKHVKEFQVVPEGQGSIKTMIAGINQGEVFVADTSGKLYAVDWRTGKIMYSYKDITGAITAMQNLSAPEESGAPFFASSSLDHMIRLHSTIPPPREANGYKASNKRGVVVSSQFTGRASAMTLIWDGAVPRVQAADLVEEDHSEDGEVGSEEEEVADDDELWKGMGQVGAKSAKGPDKDEEEIDEEARREDRSKKRR